MNETLQHQIAFVVEDRGYKLVVSYLEEPNGTALCVLSLNGEVTKKFHYPSYKIWNLYAHFTDIVDSEIARNIDGYKIAGSDGLGGGVMPTQAENGVKR